MDEIKGLLEGIKKGTDKIPEIKTKEELQAYKDKHYADLKGKITWISQAERDYDIPNPTISKWVKVGYIRVMGKNMNRTLINEQDMAFYAAIHKKFGGQGRHLFDENGLPQRPKTGPLAK